MAKPVVTARSDFQRRRRSGHLFGGVAGLLVLGAMLVPASASAVPDTDGDSDGDRLFDRTELFYGFNPGLFDTDGDGLGDGHEFLDLKTDPLKRDTDGDYVFDGEELRGGSNPLVFDKPKKSFTKRPPPPGVVTSTPPTTTR